MEASDMKKVRNLTGEQKSHALYQHSWQKYEIVKLAFSLGDFQTLSVIFSPGHFLNISKLTFMKAACKGRANTVAVLLKRNVTQVVRPDELQCAMNNKHQATALAILTHGNVSKIYLDAEDVKGKDAITLAVETPNVFFRVLQKLLQLGVDVNAEKSNQDSPLMLAVKNRAALRVIDLLLANKADLNHKNNARETALHWACRNNLTSVVKRFVTQGASLIAIDSKGDTALHWVAISDASTDIAETLLVNGAFLEARNNLKQTPFWIAVVKRASIQLVDLFLNKGAEVNVVPNDKNALLHAINNKAVNVIELLVNRGADVNAKPTALNVTALMEASSNGDDKDSLQIVKTLLLHGANVNDTNGNGDSALAYAAMYCRSKTATMLLEHGADVNHANLIGITPLFAMAAYNCSSPVILETALHYGANVNASVNPPRNDTALMLASYMKNRGNVKLLLKHGANVNARGTNGMTALNYACQSGASVDILEILISFGADVNLADDQEGLTPLLSSCIVGQIEAVALLLSHGGLVNVGNFEGNTALLFAAESSVAIVDLLLRNGADLNASNNDGENSLMLAARANNIDVVRTLLAIGMDVNARNPKNGYTPLMYAVKSSEASIDEIEILLQNGGDANLKSDVGESALELAFSSNRLPEIFRLLYRYGAVNNTVPIKRATLPLAISDKESRSETGVVAETTANVLQEKDYPFDALSAPKGNPRTNEVLKDYKLRILTLINGFYQPTVGNASNFNSRRCLYEALKFFVSVINKKNDILPRYELEIHKFEGDLPMSFQPNLQDEFYVWHRNHSLDCKSSDIQRTSLANCQVLRNVVASPVVIGPLYNQDVNVESERFAMQTQQAMSYQSSIWALRNSFGTNIYFYSNETKQFDKKAISALSLMGFLKSQIFGFKWQRIGLIAETRNRGDLASISMHNKWLVANGFYVDLVTVNDNYLETFTGIKDKGRNRILFFSTYFERCDTCYEVWCSSYRADLKPSKFIFLMLSPICLQDCYGSIYDANCSLRMQRSQMAMAFFAMQQSEAKSATTMATNIRVTDFYRSILADTGVQTLTMSEGCRQGDWTPINNAFIQAAYLLHKSSQRLQEQYGLAFHEVVNSYTWNSSQLVHKIITEVASEAEFWNSNGGVWYENVRVGAIVQANFDIQKADRRGQKHFGGDQNTWNGLAFEWRVVAKVKPLDSNDTFKLDFSKHVVIPLSPIIWATPSGKPPKDLSQILMLNGSYNQKAFYTLAFATFIVFIFQLILVYATAKLIWSRRRHPKKHTRVEYVDFGNNMIILLGCMILDISSLTLLFGAEFYPNAVCYFRPIFSVLGLSLIDAMLFSRMWLVPSFAKENRYISRKYRKPNLFNEEFHSACEVQGGMEGVIPPSSAAVINCR